MDILFEQHAFLIQSKQTTIYIYHAHMARVSRRCS